MPDELLQGISGSPGDYEGSIAYGYRGDSARLLLTAGYRHPISTA